jgi:hypothetical protein
MPNKKSNDRKKNHKKTCEYLIPAIIINSPDIAFQTALQNLLLFTIDCLAALSSDLRNNSKELANFGKCVDHLAELLPLGKDHLDQLTHKKLQQFVDEVIRLQQMINAPQSTTLDQNAATLSQEATLSAKTTYLNWLATCICEELKLSSLPNIS